MKLNELIIETFSLSSDISVKDEQGPGDLPGWDSLGHLNLMNAIERVYSVSVDMEEMIAIETVLDIRALLTEKGISDF
tara:strand:- start:1172 stop:1405 length:234 start_codon:yes stop_codon:yes gene_type:complete